MVQLICFVFQLLKYHKITQIQNGRLYKSRNVSKNPPVVSDGCVKYEEAEVHRSAIMQDFRDNDNSFLNGF